MFPSLQRKEGEKKVRYIMYSRAVGAGKEAAMASQILTAIYKGGGGTLCQPQCPPDFQTLRPCIMFHTCSLFLNKSLFCMHYVTFYVLEG